jgi:hypothetical protein
MGSDWSFYLSYNDGHISSYLEIFFTIKENRQFPGNMKLPYPPTMNKLMFSGSRMPDTLGCRKQADGSNRSGFSACIGRSTWWSWVPVVGFQE